MSNTATVITTKAGEALIAQMQAENKVLVIDKFIFANVPNRPAFPNRDDVVPVEHVVHESAVHEQGRLTENSVIYSTTLASNVGPFSFNWSGLFCSEHNVLVAINFPPPVDKAVDAPGITGNTLVRSFVLEYKGISETTNITVDPSSWQYDAHKRMSKMDNDTAQAIIDQNGKDWFIDDGFIVTPQSGAYSIQAGAGYISGHRISLDFDRIIQVPEKPAFIYVDAFREGSPTGEWQTKFTFVVSADEKDDYTDVQGVNHFVCKIAQVFEDGSVSMLRKKDKVGHYVDSINNLHTTRDAIEWRPNLKVKTKDVLQLFSHIDEHGVKSYYLPNVDELPFVTGDSWDDDVAMRRFKPDSIVTHDFMFKSNLSRLQTINASRFLSKVQKDDGVSSVTIVCRGDSLTYGEDHTVDMRPAEIVPTQSGRVHTHTRAITTYPEHLKELLSKVFTNRVNVINQGFSGDNTKISLNDWGESVNSDLTIMMLGTNDAAFGFSSYIDIDNFVQNYRAIIERELNFGAAVMLISPPPQKQVTVVTRILEAYRQAVKSLADELNLPYLDGAEMLQNCDSSVFSDLVHFKSVGYKKIASKVFARIISRLYSYESVKNGSNLTVRFPENGIKAKFQHWSINGKKTGVNSAPLTSYNGGYVVETSRDNEMFVFGFYAETDNLIVTPNIEVNNAVVSIEVDNGLKSFQYTFDDQTWNTTEDRTAHPNTFLTAESDGVTRFDWLSDPEQRDKVKIHLATQGWYTITIWKNRKNAGGDSSLTIAGLSFTDYATMQMWYVHNYKRMLPKNPIGNVIPRFIGEEYLDTSEGQYVWYKAVSLKDKSWKLLNYTKPDDLSGFGSPLGRIKPRWVRDYYLDSSTNVYEWYVSTGVGVDAWKKTTL